MPSRLGCGGLLLLGMALPSIAFVAGPSGGLIIGDEVYELGALWLVMVALGVMSVIAVFRLAYGHRDWFAPIVSAVWLGIATGSAIGTGQATFMMLTAVIALLLTSGTWADRQLDASSEGDQIETYAKPR